MTAPLAPYQPPSITIDHKALQTRAAAAIAELNSLQGATIETPEDAREAAELLRTIVRDKDKITEQIEWLCLPLKEAKRAIENKAKEIKALFKAEAEAKAGSEALVKRLLGAYHTAQQAEQRRQMQAAAQAAQERKPEALTTALVAAQGAAPPRLDGVSIRPKWVVKRIAEDLLPDEYWTPDRAKIEAVAKAATPEDPPIIPGVIFELDATVSARR
jgi:chromosome segregation ATPase